MAESRMPKVWCQLPEGDLPEGHRLIGEAVHCEECGNLMKEAGSRSSLRTWVETGRYLEVGEEEYAPWDPRRADQIVPREQQNYCSVHFGGHKGVYPEMWVGYLLDSGVDDDYPADGA